MKIEREANVEEIQIEVWVRQIREQTNPISPSGAARFVKPTYLKNTQYDRNIPKKIKPSHSLVGLVVPNT